MSSITRYLDVMVKNVPLEELKNTSKDLPIEEIAIWLKYCQENAGKSPVGVKCGRLHQDLVNILGERLGFGVSFGDYKKGPDGVWVHKNDKIIVESKTSSFWLKMDQVDGYIKDEKANCGIVVSSGFGKGDRAKIRGGFPKIRLLTTDGLCRLAELTEKEVLSTAHAVSILSPQETVELDGLVNLIHGIVEGAEAEEAKPPKEDLSDINDVPDEIKDLGNVARALYIELEREPTREFEAEELSQKIARDFAKTFAKRKSPIGSGILFSGIHLQRRGLVEIERYQPEPKKYPDWWVRKYKFKSD